MTDDFDAYHKWLGIPPEEQPPDHYRLLQINRFESDPDVVDNAANRLMSFLQDVASGPRVADSQKMLNEISAARIILLNEEKRRAYDATLAESKTSSDAKPQQLETRPIPRSIPNEPKPPETVLDTLPTDLVPLEQPVAVQTVKQYQPNEMESANGWGIKPLLIFGFCGVIGLTLVVAIAIGTLLVFRRSSDPTSNGSNQTAHDTSKSGKRLSLATEQLQIRNAPKNTHAIRITPRTFVELEKSSGIVRQDQPFTIEFWLRCNADVLISVIGDQVVDGNLADAKKNAVGWMFSIFGKKGVGPIVAFQNGGVPFQDGANMQWFHLAITNEEGELKVYQNGRQRLARQDVWKPSFTNIYIGDGPNCRRPALVGSSTFFDLTDLRISSSSRYRSDFAPPTSFSNDKDTLVLLDFSKRSSQLIQDTSGNNHHGKITGATWIETAAPALSVD